ncbi:hypothetical protein M9194_13725 [Vibrio sp. S4M6]|uniref:hypothetical protein n=1 Tax=Vibrio sinus TaxID=2946865 RepID=UPI002029F7CA|nr:hypothetical protein [Vibrio sinus]MCL9782489.1 hypothetical protein [Vibrio sinus]
MNNQITFYFCGTSRVSTLSKNKGNLDTCSGYIYDEINNLKKKGGKEYSLKLGDVHLLDGCNISNIAKHKSMNMATGGTAHGTGARANSALSHIKNYFRNPANAGKVLKINAIGHSRGCISALKLVEYIAKDKTGLANRVSIVLDLKDPVPGNLNATNNFGTAAAKRLADMSSYGFVDKAHLTFTDQNGRSKANSTGFQPLMPKFSDNTRVTVDSIIGNHGALAQVYKEYPGAYELVNTNSLELILEHAQVEDEKFFGVLRKTQLMAYNYMLAKKLRNQLSNVTDRWFHYGGKICSTGYQDPSSLNTRHRALQWEEGARINNFVALDVSAPDYYSDFDALCIRAEGYEWVEFIIDEVVGLPERAYSRRLKDLFRDTSYFPKIGSPDDMLTSESAQNILAAKTMQYLLNPHFKKSDLKRYVDNLKNGGRQLSIRRCDKRMQAVGGRDKRFAENVNRYKNQRLRKNALVS